MADKSLSKLIGTANYEIGDVIHTKATALTDGRVLLPLDGSIITPGSYTELEALLDPAATSAGQMRTFISADGTSLNSNTARSYGFKGFVNDAGTIAAIADDDADFWFQDAAAAAQAGDLGSVATDVSPIRGSSDGTEILVAACDQDTSDLVIEYTINGDTPFTSVNVEVTDDMDGFCTAFLNRAGTAGKVICKNVTDSTVDTYGSGADITTGWALDFGHSYTATPPAATVMSAASDDFATMAIIEAAGVWTSFNSGSSWVEQQVLPDGSIPASVAVDDVDNVWLLNYEPQANGSYAAGSNRLYKTTNGTSFTEVVSAEELLSSLFEVNIVKTNLLDIFTDDGDNLYLLGHGVFGSGNGAGTGAVNFLDALILWYSEDAGVTWAGNVIEHTVKTMGPVDHGVWAGTATIFYEFAMSPGGDVLMVTGTASNDSVIYYFDISKGLALPRAAGLKIVADAP